MKELLRTLSARAAAAAREKASTSLVEARSKARAWLAWLWAHRPPAPRAAALAFVGAIAVVGLWSVFTQARLPRRLPSALDWAAARALLERDARPGDAVALAPPWAERAREVLPASVPVLSHARYAREELVGVRRVWLVGLRRAPYRRWDQELDLVERASRAAPASRLGMLEVTRFDLAFPSLPITFLPDRLPQAQVSLGDVPCEREGTTRFRCGSFAVLERAVRDVGGVPRPCLSALTGAALDAPLLVTFPAARIGRTLQGHVATAPPGGAPIRVAVLLDGEEIGTAELAGGPAWSQFRVDLTRSAGQSRPLAMVLTSPGPLSVCVDAEVMP